MNTAVTDDASAAFTEEKHADFLPTDKTYRLTGEMPAEVAEKEETSEQDLATPGDKGDDKSAAASEAASTQENEEKGPATTKTAASSESRWAKITRENRELREKNARLEGERSAKETARETQQTSQPAAETKPTDAEPKIDDKDLKTGKPMYATWDEFQKAQRAWDRREALREFQESTAKATREREQEQARTTVEQEVRQRVDRLRKEHADYDEVTASGVAAKDAQGRDLIYFAPGSAVDGYILRSPRGHDVLYHILKDVDKHAHIFERDAAGKFKLTDIDQVRELALIEASLGTSETKNPSAKPVTQAPRPPHQVSGKGTVAKDAVEQAVEDNDTETYMREQNARALARRKGK